MKLNDFSAIILDLGGVLIDIDYHRTTKAFRELGIRNFEELYSQAQQEDLFDRLEVGDISAFHFINRLLDLLPPGTTANQVVHAWNAMLLKFPPESVTLIEQLAQSHRLFLLSNTNEIHLPVVERYWQEHSEKPLPTFFEKAYFSHQIGKRKPAVETFQWVVQENGLETRRTLFIDDSIQHVEGAQKAGIQVVHLQGRLANHPLFS